MSLPAAYNQISQGQIQTEFGGANPISLGGEYYRALDRDPPDTL
jgi:hypothetical protein